MVVTDFGRESERSFTSLRFVARRNVASKGGDVHATGRVARPARVITPVPLPHKSSLLPVDSAQRGQDRCN